MDTKDLRNMSVTTSTGKNVCETSQLKGEAKNSLSGTNVTKQFTTSGDASPGAKGGLPVYNN